MNRRDYDDFRRNDHVSFATRELQMGYQQVQDVWWEEINRVRRNISDIFSGRTFVRNGKKRTVENIYINGGFIYINFEGLERGMPLDVFLELIESEKMKEDSHV